MPFDPTSISVNGKPLFDPSTANLPTAKDRAGSDVPGVGGPTAADFAQDPSLATGVVRGLAGDVYGAGQIAGAVLPKSITDPVATSRAGQAVKRFATTPSTSSGEKIGRAVGAALPFVLQPELGAGAIGDAAIMGALGGAVQPTRSGSLASHAGGAATGGIVGSLGGALAGTPAQQAIRALGVRIPPGRIIPLLGREWERIASHLPVINRLISHGRQVSLDDFQRVLYRDVLQPIGGAGMPAEVGSAGLDQLYNVVTGRLNSVLSRSSLPATSTGAFRTDLATIQADAVRDMSTDTLRRFGTILQQDVLDPITMNGGMLPGSRLAGQNGVVGTLGSTARRLWKSQDPQDKALGNALDRVQHALLDHADVPGGRTELDAARQSYARYMTLSRAGSGASKEGYVDADALLSEIRQGHQDAFARGRLRLQPLATQARRAGVPSVAEAMPQTWGPLETGGAGYGAFHYPETAAAIASPSLLYNRPGMSALQAVANQARRVGAGGGTAAAELLPSLWPGPSQ